MFTHYRTQGLIFKKEDRGTADQLFTIYSKEFGRLEVLGRAIRKISSKLRSAADIFYLSELEFIQGKAYKTLTDAVVIKKFGNLKKDLKKFQIANKISEVLDDLIKGQEPDEKIWQLLNETFEKLNSCQSVKLPNYQSLYYYFLWNFLSFLGYQLDLYGCSVCQDKLRPEKLHFNPKEGGIICQGCFKKIKKGKDFQPNTVKILRIFLKKDWNILQKLKIKEEEQKELENISKNYLSFVLAENK